MPNKAMVIIEMPENCEVCPFNYDYIECTASKEYLKFNYEDFARRNDKCPLRPADVISVEWIKERYGWLTMAHEIIKEWEKGNGKVD